METIKGVIEKVEVKEGKTARGPWTNYRITVDGQRISTFDTTVGQALKVGHTYAFEVERDGDYLNLAKDSVPKEMAAEGSPIPAPAKGAEVVADIRERSIRRQVALKAAVELAGYIMAHTDRGAMGSKEIIQVAAHFDRWLNGDSSAAALVAPEMKAKAKGPTPLMPSVVPQDNGGDLGGEETPPDFKSSDGVGRLKPPERPQAKKEA